MNQAAFFGTQMATLTRDVHQLPQLGFAINRCVLQRGLQSNQTSQSGSGTIENPQRPLKNFGKYLQRPRRHERQTLSTLQREHLRHQLSQDDVQKGNRRKGDNDRQEVGNVSGPSHRSDARSNRLEHRGNGRLPDPTERERSDRDSKLGGRNEGSRVSQQTQRVLP